MSTWLLTNPCRVSLNQNAFDLYSQHIHFNAKYGFKASLLYSAGNDFFEPWTFASWYCQNSQEHPLIALNPLFVHPFVAAWKILSFCRLFNRKISINWITGASKSDFAKMGDSLTKEERFERLKEHFSIVNHLLYNNKPLTHNGKYYQLNGAFLGDILRNETVSHFIAGESELTVSTADALNIKQLVMLDSNWSEQLKTKRNLCFGLFLEETNEMAQKEASKIFDNNALGRKYFELGVQNSDSNWKHRLYREAQDSLETNYSLKPIQKFSEAPFFIGSYIQGLTFFEQLVMHKVETVIVVLAREKDYEALANIRDSIFANKKAPT